jgi:hypothetical protein
MRGPAGAFFLVSVQLLSGTFLFMVLAMLRYRVINRGYFRSTIWVVCPLTAMVSLALPAELRPAGLAAAGLMAVCLVCIYSQRPALEWVSGIIAAAGAVGLVFSMGLTMCRASCWLGTTHALAGLLLMGAVTHGMTLGHWYLNQARLPMTPLEVQTRVMLGLIVVSAGLGVATRAALVQAKVVSGLLAVSASSYWWTWALLVAGTAVLGFMILVTVKARSNQSATGLYYIAIVTALGAQFILDLLVAS